MKPDPYNSISRLAAEHGIEAACEVANFEASHVTTLKDLVDRENIECDYVVTKAMDVQLNADHCKAMKVQYDHLIQEGCQATQETEYVGKPDAEQVSIPHLPSRTLLTCHDIRFLASLEQRVVFPILLGTCGPISSSYTS